MAPEILSFLKIILSTLSLMMEDTDSDDFLSFATVSYAPQSRPVNTSFPDDIKSPMLEFNSYSSDTELIPLVPNDSMDLDLSVFVDPVVDLEQARPFWLFLNQLFHKIVGPQWTQQESAFLHHCETCPVRQEPFEQQIIQWISGDFRVEGFPNYGTEFHLNFATFPDDIVDDETLDRHLQWHQMTDLQRYYYFYCTNNLIQRERSQEDSYLDPWYYQFLCLCILWGSDYLSQQAHRLLSSIKINEWCCEYMYCGGLIREAIISSLSIDNAKMHSRLDTIFSIIGSTISDISKEGLCHWVQFFEQVENMLKFQEAFRKKILEMQSLKIALKSLDQVSLEDFVRLKMRRGILKSIKSANSKVVELEYHGCPRSTIVAREQILDENLLERVQNFVSNKN